jgi:NAD(P)-dependent dehydrogenase (short-subunit alcohol dehydrogenase family)
MDLQLQGRAALVSGGSRGIGKAAAFVLAREGADVALFARDQTANEAAAAEIANATGQRVLAFQANTGDEISVKAAVAGVADAFGRIDILVNSAAQPAGETPPALGELTDEDFWSDMNVKVMGYLRVVREVVPHMKRRAFGRIVNVSGLAARATGSIIGSMRNVSVAAMTKTVADEVRGSGITATCIHPGFTWTERAPDFIRQRALTQGLSVEEAEQQLGSWNLSGRIIKAEEVADLIAFLASPRSLAVNGESIGAGGGAPGVIHY